MNSSASKVPDVPPRAGGPAGARGLVLALLFFLLGAGLTFAWLEHGKIGAPGQGAVVLSADTLDQLRQLKSPVQIQFYSVLPPGSAPQSVQDFSQRVDRLLTAFQNANATQIQVSRNLSTAGNNADAAAASGLRPFNLENGEACFLGIVVASGGQRETLAQLRPEWEPALPYDLVRAILHVIAATPPPAAAKIIPLTPAITNEVLRLVPNIATATPEEADRIFRQDFVNQCAKAGAEMEAQINAAAQEVVKAQNGGSPADLDAARKKLAQVQFDQTEKLKDVAAHLQLQLDAFQQMKAAATNSPK